MTSTYIFLDQPKSFLPITTNTYTLTAHQTIASPNTVYKATVTSQITLPSLNDMVTRLKLATGVNYTYKIRILNQNNAATLTFLPGTGGVAGNQFATVAGASITVLLIVTPGTGYVYYLQNGV